LPSLYVAFPKRHRYLSKLGEIPSVNLQNAIPPNAAFWKIRFPGRRNAIENTLSITVLSKQRIVNFLKAGMQGREISGNTLRALQST